MRRSAIAFLVATTMAALVWALSSALSGHAEPWDADGPYYALALAVAGAISGGLLPRPLWAHYLGAVCGQAAFEVLFLGIGPLFIIGLAFLLGYSVVFLAAAAAAGFVRLRYSSRADAA